MPAPEPQPLDREPRPLGWLFAGAQGVLDLSAEEYRKLARTAGEAALEEAHGPRADRKATVALAYALCSVSAATEGADRDA